MKLERAQEYLTTFLAITAGMLAAYYVGTLAGHGRFGFVGALLLATFFVGMLLALREQIWLLIPFSLPFVGQLKEVSSHPALRDVAVIAVFGGVFALRAFKVIRRKPTYDALDFWAGVMLLYLATVYVRNPVGGDAIGSQRVGGRPYLDVFVASLAYWSLARVALPVKIAQRGFIALASLSCFTNALTILQYNVPWTAPWIGQFIGGGAEESPDMSGNTATGGNGGDGGRLFYLVGLGTSVTGGLVAGYPPMSLLNPLRYIRFLLFFGGIICLMESGFRSSLIELGMLFCVTAYLRGSLVEVLRFAVVGVFALTLLVLMQGTIINLPVSVQRSLTFLPGKWDQNVVADAQGSSNWRFDMWERMLKTDRYIENKWFGDGFGMTAMQLQQSQTALANNSPEQLKESFLVAGIVHSGPVSTIKYVGYVGLFIFMAFLLAAMREAWIICRLSRGTPYFSMALYLCVPAITKPISYVVIFGAFHAELPHMLVVAGLLKMMRTSVREYLGAQPAATPQTAPTVSAIPGRRAIPAHLQF